MSCTPAPEKSIWCSWHRSTMLANTSTLLFHCTISMRKTVETKIQGTRSQWCNRCCNPPCFKCPKTQVLRFVSEIGVVILSLAECQTKLGCAQRAFIALLVSDVTWPCYPSNIDVNSSHIWKCGKPMSQSTTNHNAFGTPNAWLATEFAYVLEHASTYVQVSVWCTDLMSAVSSAQ